MFTVKKEAFGSTCSYHLVNINNEEYVVIVPSCGAIVNAWFVKTQNGFINIIDGFEDDLDFEQRNGTSFKSNLLFPFPNRVKDGAYSFKNTTYQLPLNFPQENNAIHGLVYDQEFKVLQTQEDVHEARIVLQLDVESREGFPFPFSLKITYIFSETGLQMTSEVENTGEEEFPFGLGWHHYLKVGA
jgi:aldose 1-epimerase